MPTFIAHVAVNLHELFQNRTVAPGTLRRKPRRVVEVTVDISIMFIVRVLWAEQRWTNRARKMLNMEFLVCMTDDRMSARQMGRRLVTYCTQ